jgi:hypothetical protein
MPEVSADVHSYKQRDFTKGTKVKAVIIFNFLGRLEPPLPMYGMLKCAFHKIILILKGLHCILMFGVISQKMNLII